MAEQKETGIKPTKDKRKILLRILYITLTISVIAVWGQSCLNKAASTVRSDMVVGMFLPVDEMKNGTDAEFLEYDRTAALIRKIAHIIEYAILGFQIMCILYLHYRNKLRDHVICLYAGLTIALIDETIQIFSRRGPLVSDLWIDLAGILLGTAAAFLICMIINKKVKTKI